MILEFLLILLILLMADQINRSISRLSEIIAALTARELHDRIDVAAKQILKDQHRNDVYKDNRSRSANSSSTKQRAPQEPPQRSSEYCARPRLLSDTERDSRPTDTPITIYTQCFDMNFVKEMQLKSMPADNSCMFHSLACALSWKFQTTAPELRKLTADYMLANIKQFANLSGQSVQDIEAHIKLLRKPTTFGESIDMLAVASMCNLTIKIYLDGADVPTCLCIKPSINLPDIYQLDHSVAYLHFKKNHYNVFV